MMNRRNRFDRLDLEDQRACDDEIQTLVAQQFASVPDRVPRLTIEADSGGAEFNRDRP